MVVIAKLQLPKNKPLLWGKHCISQTKRNRLLQQCIILDILFGIVPENVYFACLFLESVKC